MPNREFLQLAKNYKSEKHGVGGWYASEKLDGMRAYWDGGISRGTLTSEVRYANTAKNSRLKKEPVATGLWSRYGNVIHAPDWFLNQLPELPLDGELYLGRGRFQEGMSIIKRFDPDERWNDVCYVVFDSPSNYMMFAPGRINNPNFQLIMPDIRSELKSDNVVQDFYQTLNALQNVITETRNLKLHKQTRLPSGTFEANAAVYEMLEDIYNRGGEGVMLRKPDATWVPRRVDSVLKVKKLLDAEGVVVGYTWGKGKLEGLMGALIITYHYKQFELSGFTNDERAISPGSGEPGTIIRGNVCSPSFPIGSKVSFRFTELSVDGIPLKARYWRK